MWSWGCNSGGKLGLGDKKDRYDPVLVPRLKHKIILQVSAGTYHSMALVQYPPMRGGGEVVREHSRIVEWLKLDLFDFDLIFTSTCTTFPIPSSWILLLFNRLVIVVVVVVVDVWMCRFTRGAVGTTASWPRKRLRCLFWPSQFATFMSKWCLSLAFCDHLPTLCMIVISSKCDCLPDLLVIDKELRIMIIYVTDIILLLHLSHTNSHHQLTHIIISTVCTY